MGATVVTRTGCVTHIIHLLSSTEIDFYGREISEGVEVSAMFLAKQLFVTGILRRHFGLEKGFAVRMYDGSERSRRRITATRGQGKGGANERGEAEEKLWRRVRYCTE